MALEYAIADTRQIDGVGERAGLWFFVRRAHPSFAIGIGIRSAWLLRISSRGRRPRHVTVWIMPPGYAVEVVVLIHRGEGVGERGSPGE